MRRYTVEVNGKAYVIDVEELASDRFHVRLGHQSYDVRLRGSEDVAGARITPEVLPLRVEGEAENEKSAITPVVPSAHRPPAPEAMPPLPLSRPPGLPPQSNIPGAEFRREIVAPMPGTVLSIHVSPGDRVSRGQTMLILEAMKMKNAIKAPHDAVVASVPAQAGQSVGYGHVLVTFEPPN